MLLATIDYSQTDWSQFDLTGNETDLTTETHLRLGIEYTPNRYTLKRHSFISYLKRISYRAGAYQNK
ncbi:MAG: hypothetical protein HC896_10325 [Bacteroidales bacterium]|nr:hypothetical protein [Bacteroidales bacterium]